MEDSSSIKAVPILDKYKFEPFWIEYVEFKKAIRCGNVEKVKLLLESGVSLDLRDDNCSLLHLAVNVGSLEIVQLLVSKGAPTLNQNCNHENSLSVAAKIGKYEIADYLLDVLALTDYNNFHNYDRLLLLHIASMRNKVHIVKKLIACGEYINHFVTADSIHWPGYTPLHFAVQFNCLETVEHLLRCGADFTIKDVRQLTPLHLAHMLENVKIIDLILSYHKENMNNPVDSTGLSHFHIACTRNNPDVVESFIAHGADVNMKVSEKASYWSNFRPINFAIYHECIDTIKLLLSYKIYLKRSEGISISSITSAVHQAYHTRNVEIIYLISSRKSIKKIIDMNAKDKHISAILNTSSYFWTRYTPLHLAIEHNNPHEVSLQLLANESYISMKDAKGHTPLHLAFKSRYQWDIVNLILASHLKVDENPLDTDGISHFHIACTSNNLEVIKHFLKSGVDINDPIPTKSNFWPGYTPLHLAVEFEKEDVVNLLLNRGADFSVKNKFGLSAFDIAVNKYGKFETDNQICASVIESMLLKSLKDNVKTFDDHGFCLLHLYSLHKNVNTVGECLKWQPGNINKKINLIKSEYCGWTPLMFAVNYGSCEVVQFLLKNGANAFIKDSGGYSPLHVWLKDKKDDLGIRNSHLMAVNDVDGDGDSYFRWACIIGNLRMVNYMIKHGVDVNEPKKFKHLPSYETPLQDSVFGGEQVIKTLLRSGANVLACDAEGNTVLHHAMDVCDIDTTKAAEIFLNNGVDVNEQNLFYQTPMHLLYQFGADKDFHQKKIELLLNRGADINIEDEEGQTPFTVLKFLQNIDFSECYLPMMKHILKLELIGYCISDKNKQHYSKFLNLFKTEFNFNDVDYKNCCSIELKQLKNSYIDKYTSLYNILFKSLNQLALHRKSSMLKKIITSKHFDKTYLNYGYLIKIKFEQGKTRRPLLQRCKKFFKLLPLVALPDSCVEHILQYLSNKDLENLISSFNNV